MRLSIGLALLIAACGGSSASEPGPQPPKPAKRATATPAKPVTQRPPSGSLWRDELVATIDQGLGYFLQRVTVEPELASGRFVGFRITELRPSEWWRGVDLRIGDIVTHVNGMPIERETEAFAAFETLRTAEALRVSYIRAGEQRQLIYKIVDRGGPRKTDPSNANDPARSQPAAPAPTTGASTGPKGSLAPAARTFSG